MPATREIIDHLDTLLEAEAFSDGQENGLQVEGKPEIQRVASAVSVSHTSIEAAIGWDADALLTHHGLLWKNQPLHVRGVRRARLRLLLEHDLNLITYHLPLDAHADLGNNAALAHAAGCEEARPAFALGGQTIGMLGSLAAPMPFEQWHAQFEEMLRQDCEVETGPFQVWPFGPEKVRRIGLLSGAAPYQVQDAIDAGCDVYITGESTEGVYHLAKEAGIHFIAGGHYLTERFGVQRLGAHLADRFGIEHRFFDVETRA